MVIEVRTFRECSLFALCFAGVGSRASADFQRPAEAQPKPPKRVGDGREAETAGC